MPMAGYIAAQGQMNLWLAIVVGTVGTLVGTLPWYGVGRWLGHDRVYRWVDRHGHWLTVTRGELERADRWFANHGRVVVLLARLVPGVRTVISLPAGFCRMPLGRYLAYSAVGTAVWTGVLAYLGQLLGKNYQEVSTYLGPVTWGIVGVLLVIYVVRLVRMRKQNHARRAREEQQPA